MTFYDAILFVWHCRVAAQPVASASVVYVVHSTENPITLAVAISASIAFVVVVMCVGIYCWRRRSKLILASVSIPFDPRARPAVPAAAAAYQPSAHGTPPHTPTTHRSPSPARPPSSHHSLAPVRSSSSKQSPARTPKVVPAESLPVVAAKEAAMCVLCLSEPAQIALIPCGHRCFCGECASQFMRQPAPSATARALNTKQCPSCRAPVKDLIRIFDV